jgi:hypothetical protein
MCVRDRERERERERERMRERETDRKHDYRMDQTQLLEEHIRTKRARRQFGKLIKKKHLKSFSSHCRKFIFRKS